MPRSKVLSPQEKAELLFVPSERELLAIHYTFSDEEKGWIREVHTPINQLGFALQLAFMKYPGVLLRSDWQPSRELVGFAAEQIGIRATLFEQYPVRGQTLLDHSTRIQRLLKVRPYDARSDRQSALGCVVDLAACTDHGATIVRALIDNFRKWHILLPSVAQLEALAAEAITLGERTLHSVLTSTLTSKQRDQLQQLLHKKRHGKYELTWLTESVEAPSVANILGHIERLLYLRTFALPDSLREKIHEERLARMADITSKSHLPGLREHKLSRQLAGLVAVVLDFEARIIDEVLALYGKMIGLMHNNAKVKQKEKILADAEAMRDAVLLLPGLHRVLNKGRKENSLPYESIRKIISWEDFDLLVDDIKTRTKDDGGGSLPFVIHSFNRFHRFIGPLLKTIEFHAADAVKDVLAGVKAVKQMQHTKVDPSSLPIEFVPPKWEPLVIPESGLNTKYYELCALTRLNDGLRSGDIWVTRSHRFKDFEDYLIPRAKYESIKAAKCLPVAIETDCEKYLTTRLSALAGEVKRVEAMAKNGLLDGVTLTPSKLRISREERDTPIEAIAFRRELYNLLPTVKITDLFHEVDSWVNFSRCFTDTRTGQEPPDRLILHTALLAKGLNLGCEKMAQACPDDDITTSRLALVDIHCLRPEAYSSAFGLLLEAQKNIPIAAYWGDATTSSSDGQRFRTTRHAYDTGSFSAHYGSEPGLSVLTHVVDVWSPAFATVITGTAEEAPFLLDGLLYCDPTIVLKEHYSDTAGLTDHVFAFTNMFGFRYAPRPRNFSELKLHLPADMLGVDALQCMVGDSINIQAIRSNWDEILRAATSIKHGKVRASTLMRKLASFPRQNRLALAFREFGRIERSLFMLQWISDPDFRRRVHRGLNKGEAVHSLTRAVSSIGRAGEIRDRTLEQQIRRANGFNLMVSVISLWNTVYLNRALNHLIKTGVNLDRHLLGHMSPLGYDHITLTGDYIWPDMEQWGGARFRPLRADI